MGYNVFSSVWTTYDAFFQYIASLQHILKKKVLARPKDKSAKKSMAGVINLNGSDGSGAAVKDDGDMVTAKERNFFGDFLRCHSRCPKCGPAKACKIDRKGDHGLPPL